MKARLDKLYVVVPEPMLKPVMAEEQESGSIIFRHWQERKRMTPSPVVKGPESGRGPSARACPEVTSRPTLLMSVNPGHSRL